MSRSHRNQALGILTTPECGVGQEADLLPIGESVKLRLTKMQAFTRSENPVVERARGGQVASVLTACEKFRLAPCMSPSIKLLRRHVQWDRSARSPAVRPADSISSKSESA